VTLDPYNAFLHRADEDGSWRVGVKDVIDVAGMPTTAASKVLHRVPDRDAECVARLRAAGATIAGKLNTHEFAFGALTNSPHFGPALNPWDTERVTGGSSGGSGAAVAAGLVDVALGTDTAGSIRIPAALCGVTGHRPTAGLVPVDGVVPVAWTLDAVGPLARSAAECRRALEVMAGCELERKAPKRIGVIRSLFEQADPEVAEVCGEAARALGDAEPVELPLHEEIATITQLVMLPEAAAVHVGWLRTKLADYGPDVRARALAGLLLPSTAYVTGLRARNWVRSLWADALGGYDLLVAPAMPIVAPRLDDVPPEYRLLIMPYNSPASLLGLPPSCRAVSSTACPSPCR
jgi:aspartyl-tRNA(Asn)/glutamyl-tRNA(Gln) amidotransferase subunit A